MAEKLNIVTGAFSFTGRYISRRLLLMGERVRTLTGHPRRENPFGKEVEVYPYNFDRPEELMASLRGADTLYNTYWIRFCYGEMSFERAIANTKVLIESAKKAGVKRVVHISITNADKESKLPYFSGKGMVEQLIRESGLSYAILRPTVIFGKEDILINNIAWCLRHLPVFAVFGNGNYRLQPICVEDLAELAVEAGHKSEEMIFDTAGPETFTYNELLHLIKSKINSPVRIIHLPPWLVLSFTWVIGKFVKDIVLTKDEVAGLMAELLYSREPPRGKTKLSLWLEENKESIGCKYSSELIRHYEE